MGEVFLARSVGAAGFQKHVVIKKLLPHLVEQTQFVQALIREAKLLVRLDHPSIVQVLDLGMEGSDYFMAMEYVHGYNLATIIHYCSQNQLVIPLSACAALTLQVLAGLGYAHSLPGPDGTRQNVVHRDVSPQNVLISMEGRVKLTDFGIAKVVNEAEGEFTQSLKGKFRYMAPEVVDGGRIDHRYDLFAAGILLFEVLCRRHLFSGSNDLAILAQVRKAVVPPIARYHPQVPRELALVAEKALAKEPARRYQTAEEFAEAIREAIKPSTEAEGLAELRLFITDLFARPDFPLNKPKLPDLNAGATNVTKSLTLRSRLAVNKAREEAGRRRRLLLTAGIGLLVALVGVVTYWASTRMVEERHQAPAQGPVIIVTPRDAGAHRPADSARAPEVSVPDATRQARVRPPTPRLPPAKQFSAHDAKQAFASRDKALRQCLRKHTAPSQTELRVVVVSSILGSGAVKQVQLEPATLESTPLGRCLIQVAKTVRYNRHDQALTKFRQPIVLYKTE